MSTRSAPQLLRDAAQLVEMALIQLDLTHEMCRACTATRYQQIEHKRIYDRFSDTPFRLVEAAEAIENPTAAAAKRRLGHEVGQNIKRARRAAAQRYAAKSRIEEDEG